MTMKRSQQRVPGAQTGSAASDGGNTSTQWVNAGGRNAATDASRRGAGQLAPRPRNSWPASQTKHTGPSTAGLARVKPGPAGPPEGRFLPVHKPPAGLQGATIGQPDPHSFNPGGPGISVSPKTQTPQTGNSTATRKPKTRAALAFYGE